MNVFSSLLFLIPPLLGIALVWFIFEKAASFFELILFCILGSGAGIGISSLAYFAWSALYNPAEHLEFFWGILAAAAVLLGGLSIRRLRKDARANARMGGRDDARDNARRQPVWKTHFSVETIALGGILAVVSILSILHFLSTVQAEPRGSWDAVAIWNVHALFMFLGREHWLDGFNNLLALSHPGYPYLLPSTIALGWSIFGKARFIFPNLLALFFTYANAGVLFFGLARLRDVKQALLATIVLVGAPAYIQLGADRIADTPLSFYMLSLCVVSALYFSRSPSNRKILALIGMLLGCLIWVKNDGWSLLVAFFLGWGLIAILKKEFRKILAEIPWILLGLAPFFAVVLYFKTSVAPPDDMLALAAQGGPAFISRHLFALERYLTTLKWLAGDLWILGGWKISLLLIVGAYAVLNGFSRQRLATRGLLTIASFLVCALGGYFFVYILTPYDLVWHLSTSAQRLLMHLFPAFLFGLFYAANSPPNLWETTRSRVPAQAEQPELRDAPSPNP